MLTRLIKDINMSLLPSIAETTNAEIYYHTDVFHWKINLALATLGVVALTSLVVGILAATHGVYIPSQATYGTLIGGGGVLLIESIVLIVLIVRHHQRANVTQVSPEGCSIHVASLHDYEEREWTHESVSELEGSDTEYSEVDTYLT